VKQTNLFDYYDKKDVRKRYGRTQHGGSKTKGHRKLERPLSTKNWIHLVLKSDKAKGPFSFLLPKNKQIIKSIIRAKAKKFGVTMADGANVGNHLHLKIKIQSRESFQKFLKSITCLIARKITGARRGVKFGRFWQGLAFTRVLTSSLEELNLKGYIKGNRVEARKGEKAREAFLQTFNAWFTAKDRKISSTRIRTESCFE
jgi:REP element-mobilizing transposase RayT